MQQTLPAVLLGMLGLGLTSASRDLNLTSVAVMLKGGAAIAALVIAHKPCPP